MSSNLMMNLVKNGQIKSWAVMKDTTPGLPWFETLEIIFNNGETLRIDAQCGVAADSDAWLDITFPDHGHNEGE